MPQNLLEQLRKYTMVVADTGDMEAMEKFHPQDATTNPSLITAAAQMPQYQPIVDGVLKEARNELGESASDKDVAKLAFKRLAVAFGKKILAIVPGRVSTEVDARLSYDTENTIAQARDIIAQYDKAGIGRERILIKIASTWEGIRAAEVLEKEGIHCNLTLLFGMHQAIACAEAGVTLISPFVGRILDWYKKDTGKDYQGADDPGVQSVTTHLQLLQEVRLQDRRSWAPASATSAKSPSWPAATCSPSRRNCSPSSNPRRTICRASSIPRSAKSMQIEKIPMDKATFDTMHAADRMAHDKLKEGIEGFSAALVKLESLLAKRLAELESAHARHGLVAINRHTVPHPSQLIAKGRPATAALSRSATSLLRNRPCSLPTKLSYPSCRTQLFR